MTLRNTRATRSARSTTAASGRRVLTMARISRRDPQSRGSSGAESRDGRITTSSHRPSPITPTPIVEMRGISKRFGPVVANDRISLDLWPGEIHAVLGENGAGKTTLMNILSGMYQPDAGSITLGGESVTIDSPSEALALGIGTVYQHFTLVPNLSIIENVMLGTKTGFVLNLKRGEQQLREL